MTKNDSPAGWRFKVLYDGECPICRREIEFMRRRDRHRRLAFEDITAPGFDPAAYNATQEELMGVVHGVFPDGRMVQKLEVFQAAYRYLGIGWLVAPLGWPGIRWVANRAYEWFARHRIAIGNLLGRPKDRACPDSRCQKP